MDGWVRQCMHLNSLPPRGMTRKPQHGCTSLMCPCALPSHAEPRRPMGWLAVICCTYTALFQLLNPAGRSSAPLVQHVRLSQSSKRGIDETVFTGCRSTLDTREWPLSVSPSHASPSKTSTSNVGNQKFGLTAQAAVFVSPRA